MHSKMAHQYELKHPKIYRQPEAKIISCVVIQTDFQKAQNI